MSRHSSFKPAGLPSDAAHRVVSDASFYEHSKNKIRPTPILHPHILQTSVEIILTWDLCLIYNYLSGIHDPITGGRKKQHNAEGPASRFNAADIAYLQSSMVRNRSLIS